MVSASALRAKLAGLMVEKVEVGDPGDFSDCETIPQIVDRMLAGPGGPAEQFRPIDQGDRQALLDLVERHRTELEEFMENIKSRPQILVRCELKDLSRPWRSHALQPYEIRRLEAKQRR